MKNFIWILRLAAAIILLQTLFFKFTAAPESVYIFEKLGAGALGRIGSGLIELLAAILLLWPTWTKLGSLIGLGVMSVAILSHLSILGIEVMDDGGTLFILANVVWVTCLLNIFLTPEKLSLKSFSI